jgi:hypothetical protein
VTVLHWLIHVTGSDYGLPYGHFSWYDCLSGAGSDLGELALFGALIAWYRRNECHVDTCKRIAHRTVHGTDDDGRAVTYLLCRRHSPARAPTAGDVRRHHARGRQAA